MRGTEKDPTTYLLSAARNDKHFFTWATDTGRETKIYEASVYLYPTFYFSSFLKLAATWRERPRRNASCMLIHTRLIDF